MGQKIFYSGEMELTRGIGGFEPRGNRLLYGGNGVRRIHLKVEEMNLVRWRSFKSNATLVRFLGFLYTFWMLLDQNRSKTKKVETHIQLKKSWSSIQSKFVCMERVLSVLSVRIKLEVNLKFSLEICIIRFKAILQYN